jgi:hypothetical protein
MKFWTTVIGIVATIGAKYGIQVDAATQAEIAGFFGLLLGAQGLTDHGKAAAAIAAAPPPIAAPGQPLAAGLPLKPPPLAPVSGEVTK